jgi:hypothetical protein
MKIHNMKRFLNWLWNGLKYFWASLPKIWLVVFIITAIVGLIFGINIGIFTLFGLSCIIIIFVLLRQAWWYITSTGDYEKDNTEK